MVDGPWRSRSGPAQESLDCSDKELRPQDWPEVREFVAEDKIMATWTLRLEGASVRKFPLVFSLEGEAALWSPEGCAGKQTPEFGWYLVAPGISPGWIGRPFSGVRG